MGLAGVAMLVAGPIMISQGVNGQSMISDELAAQKISFPEDEAKLPPALQEYAGVQVTTGPEAKAFAEYIKGHVTEATGGRTYSEVSAEWIAGGRKDADLAHQAWQLTWLVIALGALLVGLSAVFGVTAWTLRPQRIAVPASPEALESKHLVA
jgi:hypothetical protein